MVYLQNEHIKAGFSKQGAELQSLESYASNINYIWNGNPDFWGKHSPVLFPIVGGLKDNTYFYKGVSYHLPRHGFARDNQFICEHLNDNELVFTLTSNQETLKQYPFEFELKLNYKLIGTELFCTYEVINISITNDLLFSIGGHPAFSTPVSADISYSDYYLKFNADTALVYHTLQRDLITEVTEIINLKQGEINLSKKLFENDALVFKTLKSDCIAIRNEKNAAYQLDFKFENFPYFGIWAAKGADFVCLEPWCGIADVVGHDQQLSGKEGIVTLPASQSWNKKWSVKVH